MSRWRFPKDLICHYSAYFEQLARPTGNHVQHEAQDLAFELPDQNPKAFALFVEWLFLSTGDKNYQNFDPDAGLYKDSYPWRRRSVTSWLLAEHIRAPEFSKYALAKVVQNAELLDIFQLEDIYENAPLNSPLRRFISLWVPWKVRNTNPHLWDSTRNREFRQDRIGSQGTLDPRRFEIDHWYADCSSSRSPCDHATVNTTKTGEATDTNVELTPRELYRQNTRITGNAKFDRMIGPLAPLILAYGWYIAGAGVLVGVIFVLIVFCPQHLLVVNPPECHPTNCNCSSHQCHCAPCHCEPCSCACGCGCCAWLIIIPVLVLCWVCGD